MRMSMKRQRVKSKTTLTKIKTAFQNDMKIHRSERSDLRLIKCGYFWRGNSKKKFEDFYVKIPIFSAKIQTFL